MTTQDNTPNDAAKLRQKAEALARQRSARTPEDCKALSPEELRDTLHELRVHQIELEMQNEELRTAQEEIEAGRARYFDLYELAPVGYCTLSEKGLILEANLTAATLLGRSRGALIKQPISLFILKEDQDIYYRHRKQLFETGHPQECELRMIKPDGTFFWAHLAATAAQAEDGMPVCRVVLSDITERKQIEAERENLQTQLNQTKKIEAIGTLAGGIAHDFNNILTAILGNISLADIYIEKGNKAHSLLKEAEKASLRAKGLTEQLLTFSKGGDPVRETASIKQVITDSADFVLHGGNVRCRYAFPEDLWLVDIDSGQMSQVIQNLAINARHAMPTGGEIKISCENVADITKETSLTLPGEKYIKITIADHGSGIPEKYLDKIFDPYFSTKQEGSGLGLAITHSIITKHDGHIFVQSKSGEGTTFTIYLPAAAKQISREVKEEAQKPEKTVSGTILLMDDEEMIRNMTKTMLSRFGHDVLQAKDGEEAIAIFREHYHSDNPVDVIIMDLTIPGGMGGKEAIKEILKIAPEARAIVSSGYANDPVMANYHQYGFKAALSKPFEMAQLKKTVNSFLG